MQNTKLFDSSFRDAFSQYNFFGENIKVWLENEIELDI